MRARPGQPGAWLATWSLARDMHHRALRPRLALAWLRLAHMLASAEYEPVRNPGRLARAARMLPGDAAGRGCSRVGAARGRAGGHVLERGLQHNVQRLVRDVVAGEGILQVQLAVLGVLRARARPASAVPHHGRAARPGARRCTPLVAVSALHKGAGCASGSLLHDILVDMTTTTAQVPQMPCSPPHSRPWLRPLAPACRARARACTMAGMMSLIVAATSPVASTSRTMRARMWRGCPKKASSSAPGAGGASVTPSTRRCTCARMPKPGVSASRAAGHSGGRRTREGCNAR